MYEIMAVVDQSDAEVEEDYILQTTNWSEDDLKMILHLFKYIQVE